MFGGRWVLEFEEWRTVAGLVGRGLSGSVGWIGKEECLSIGWWVGGRVRVGEV